MAFNEALGASYRLGERIGSGAAGEVWRATDLRTGETVAAKILRPEHAADPTLVERFVRERSILIGLRHPNIVAVRDLVVEGDRLAIVMDYLDSGSLRDALSGMGNAPAHVAARITAAVLDGLAAAHQRQVLHRDIKPDNVLLRSDWRDRDDGIKVTDFGIAGLITDRPRSSTGLIGTPEYMSPELITTGAAGPATDVYGAGILLYELMAGRTPYAGPGTDFTIAYRHVTVELPRLDLPDQLWTLLQRLLAKNPKARPSAADAAAALRRLDRSLQDVPALAPVSAPEEFTEAARPATALRSIFTDPSATVDEGTVSTPASPQSPVSLPDLGTPTHATIHRPMPRRSVETPDEPEGGEDATPDRPWWRAPWAIAAAVGAVAILVVAGVLVVKLGPKPKPPGPSPKPQAAFQASQQDQPTPTGLGISRKAEYDASSAQIQLTITYSAQKAPLRGPFLEVLPGVGKGASCPTVTWSDGPQQQNLPSVTGIDRACGWSINTIEVPAQETQQVSVAVHQKINDESQLQGWLDAAAKATTDAVQDPDVAGTAYPVQRMQDIEVSTPSRIVSERTLPITLVPVWPGGDDRVNPLYKSPASGDPSSMLVAVAGGEQGVRFSDGCSGALAVSSDGLTVTTLSQSPECTVNARVGNFTDLSSSPFAIVTRGG
ncbi:MAG TPA: protein kinase [Microlunatus sp.]